MQFELSTLRALAIQEAGQFQDAALFHFRQGLGYLAEGHQFRLDLDLPLAPGFFLNTRMGHLQAKRRDASRLRAFSPFIIGEGPVTASSRTRVRWRRMASLKRKPCSSSFRVS